LHKVKLTILSKYECSQVFEIAVGEVKLNFTKDKWMILRCRNVAIDEIKTNSSIKKLEV
jgi:hypothetical protein